jgi:hypothetical protein
MFLLLTSGATSVFLSCWYFAFICAQLPASSRLTIKPTLSRFARYCEDHSVIAAMFTLTEQTRPLFASCLRSFYRSDKSKTRSGLKESSRYRNLDSKVAKFSGRIDSRTVARRFFCSATGSSRGLFLMGSNASYPLSGRSPLFFGSRPCEAS